MRVAAIKMYRCHACTVNPTALPKQAPIAIDGSHTPAGTLIPKHTLVMKNLRMAAMISDKDVLRKLSWLVDVTRRLAP